MGIFDRFKTKDQKDKKEEPKKYQATVELAKKSEVKPDEKQKSLLRQGSSSAKASGDRSAGRQVLKSKAIKTEAKPEDQAAAKADKKSKLKGTSDQAHKVLIKPLITEKASSLGVLNKYVFAINPRMNKIEVKKAIRTIYGVDPVKVNILNFSGKKVKYGRISGQTKSWKKAVVTLKEGDKIEVYEGV